MELSVNVRGLARLQAALKAEGKRQNRALETAIKVEGFRLRKVLQSEIRAGAPGGRRFAALSEIRARTGRSRRPLRRLATAVRYHVTKEPFQMAVGWTGPKVSKRWKALAEMHQEGFTREVTEKLRAMLRAQGGALKGRWTGGRGRSGAWHFQENKAAKYFFLRAGTTRLRTPARPILDPFWARHQEEAWKNIRRNYLRKLWGERI